MYLLDSNILIKFLKGNTKIEKFLTSLKKDRFSISIISRLEVLMGVDKESHSFSEIEEYLDYFKNINLDKKIVKEAVLLSKKSKKNLKFKDLIIAATAKIHKNTLITSDNDFYKLPGIPIKYL